MPKCEPAFAVKALDDVSLGALVIFGHALAFAGINRSAPAKLITLAAHDANSSRFVYRYFDACGRMFWYPAAERSSSDRSSKASPRTSAFKQRQIPSIATRRVSSWRFPTRENCGS
jgi:hypothetical protein